ncbi:DNA mismatch repair protein Msh2-like [Centruroides sculpturatus]|uniref:DNA mismatch repair protein Msh2-like n=1 Tax=Centruroides sculpturatus TaxID=218467 RepID=UPI000C6DDB10|nr:DNA mismatch repair protein Msh2-like [Centruroides sculpturatus]
MTTIEEEIRDQFYKVAKDLGLEPDKSVKLENCSQIGYYFRVTKKEEKALRKKNYITIDAKNNGVRFHNAMLRKLNEKYVSLRLEYETHQKSVIELIIGIASGYSEPMQQLSDLLAQLDVYIAFSMSAIGAPQPFVRPKLMLKENGIISMKQARHPCLEVQENIDFIPNDVILDKKEKNFHIITGPNMGGKSTFIRSVAINVLMAQIGSFIPCEEGNISIVDAILTRVGAGDIQLKGVSTFMAEMLETASILKSATENSLIIIDELGRGTSTYDGFGLAWAISDHIANKINAYCLFATHFHELTALAEKAQNVSNLQVTALTSEENITFLYKIKEGICDQSFGIHVAELVHFPSHVIELAKQKLSDFEDFHWNNASSNEEEPVAKSRKIEYEEAEQIMKEYITDICSSLNSAEKELFNMKLNNLKDNIVSKNNSYINELISKA